MLSYEELLIWERICCLIPNDYLSNRSKGTLTHLYLDAADTYDFVNFYDAFDGNSLKELSLENVNVEAMDNLPDMDNLEYLNLSKSGITSLIGENKDFDGWFNVSRYKNIKTLDISGVQADIADGRIIETAKYAEESTLFENIRTERSDYIFEGWYDDSKFDTLFWGEGMEKPAMPAHLPVIFQVEAPFTMEITYQYLIKQIQVIP